MKGESHLTHSLNNALSVDFGILWYGCLKTTWIMDNCV